MWRSSDFFSEQAADEIPTRVLWLCHSDARQVFDLPTLTLLQLRV